MKKASRQILIFVLVMTFISTGAIPALAEHEEEITGQVVMEAQEQYGDVLYSTMANVGPILFGARYEGTLTTANPFDVYTIVLTEPGRLTINVSRGTYPEWRNIGFQWLDSAERQLQSTNEWLNSPYNGSMDLEAGTYYFRAIRSGDNTGTYFFTATFAAANNNQGVASSANPRSLLMGERVRSFLSHQNTYDYYSVVIPEPGRLSMNVSSGTYPAWRFINFQWFDGTESQLRSTDEWLNSPYNGSMDLEAGTYYFRVARRGNNTGTYFLTATFTAAKNNTRNINSSIPPLAQAQYG
jgi:hypothetical protein